MNFKEFRKDLAEAAESIDAKSFKVGKYKAVIKKEGNKFVAFLDGEKFDTFKTDSEAKKGLKDFVQLLGKE